MNWRSMWLGLALAATALANHACSGGGAQKEPDPAATSPAPKVDPASAATITGTVILDGTPPAQTVLNMASNAECAALHPERPILAGDVLVADGKVANAVVYVKSGLPVGAYPAPATPVEIDQQACAYQPRVATLTQGQKLIVKNGDAFLHNVRGPDFNFSLSRKGLKREVEVGANSNEIEMKCDVHSWMKGFVWTFPHPYHAVTNAAGSFTLANLPPGSYTIGVWHERLGSREEAVTLGARESKSLEIHLRAP